MAVRVKREPGPMLESPLSGAEGGGSAHRICYVCGGAGGVFALYSRPRERGSYFPFLEQHEIPYAAERPTEDGQVLACMLCYSLLSQQWESFERTRTPHAKRLYWLKRADNGHYVGAEMRLQGEYASQMIGVSPDAGLAPSVSNTHSHYGGSTAGSPAVRHQQHGGSSGGGLQHHSVAPSRGSVDGGYYAGRETSYVANRSVSAAPPSYHPSPHERDVATASVLLDLRGGGASATVRTSSSLGGTPCGSPRSFRSRGNDTANANDTKLELAVSAPPPVLTASVPANGVLDLSMPDKNEKSEACYLCGAEVLRSDLVSVYAKPVANCPFFPSLMHHPRQSHSRPMDYSGCVQACAACHQHLLQQWDVFQRKNVPHSERRYQLRQPSPVGAPHPPRPPSLGSPPPPPPPDFICFLCGQEFEWSLRHFLYTGANPEGEAPLPFLERVKPSRGALPFSAAGRALACGSCHRAIHRKRPAYQGISEDSRPPPPTPPQQQQQQQQQHHGLPTSSSSSSSFKVSGSVDGRVDFNPAVHPPSREPDRPPVLLSCQACRRPIQRGHLKVIDFLPHREPGRSFHPFTSDGESGGVPVCASCFSVYLTQFDAFEEEGVAHQHRRYVVATLPSPRHHHHHQQQQQRAEEDGSLGAVSPPPFQPVGRDGYPSVPPVSLRADVGLRIRVPSPVERDYSIGQQQQHHHLLTTVSTSVSSSPVSTISVGQPAPAPSSSVATPTTTTTTTSNALDLTGGPPSSSLVRSNLSSPTPRSSVSHAARPSASFVCYVCGLRSRGSERPYPVRTFPLTSAEGDSPVPSTPFFPSLTMHVTPPEASSALVDGTLATCVFCFHSLLLQWSSYELSPRRQTDCSPWTRAYDCHDFVCYICGVTTYRKRVRRISVSDFPFLVEHPRPPGSLVLDVGDGVAVCLMCYDTLSAQWNDFERMKVPLELRKYNWIAAPPPPEDDEGRTSSPNDAQPSQQGSGEGGKSNHHHQHHHHPDDEQQQQSGFVTSRRSIIEQDSSFRRASFGSIHGSKAIPPLTGSGVSSVSNGNGSLKSNSHLSIANVPPPPPLSQMSPGSSSSHRTNATKGSSFAAALRKLAEQATDLPDKDMSPVSSASPPCSQPVSKRAPPPLILSSDTHQHQHQQQQHHPSVSLSSGFASPPPAVVAPSHHPHHHHHLNYGEGARKQSMDQSHSMIGRNRSDPYDDIHSAADSRHGGGAMSDDGRHGGGRGSVVSPGGPSYGDRETSSLGRRSSAAGFLRNQHQHLVGELSPADKMGDGVGGGPTHAITYGERGRDELRFSAANGLIASHSQHTLNSQIRLHPQPLASALPPRMEEHYASGGSFQPYRSSEDAPPPRLSAHVSSPYEPSSPGYPYHPSAFVSHSLPQPPFRLEDHLYLDRYSLLRPPLYPVGHHPGVLPPAHHALPFLTSAPRYAPELMQHPLGLVSPPVNHLQSQERLKVEDGEQQPRRDFYQELTRRERKLSGSDGNVSIDRDRRQKGPWEGGHARASESPVHSAGGGVGSIMQGTPRDHVLPKGPATSWQGPASVSPPPSAGQPQYSSRHPASRHLAEGHDNPNHNHQRRSGVVNTVSVAKSHYNALIAGSSDRPTYDGNDGFRMSRTAGNGGGDYAADSRHSLSGVSERRSPTTTGHSSSVGGGQTRGSSAFHHVSNLAPSNDEAGDKVSTLNVPREWENGVRHDYYLDQRSTKDNHQSYHQQHRQQHRAPAWHPEQYDPSTAASTRPKPCFQQERRRRRSESSESRPLEEEVSRRRSFVDVEVSWCGPAEQSVCRSSPRAREGRSKLDLAEERRSQLGLDVTSESSEVDSDSEEGGEAKSRYAHLLAVTVAPPLPLDSSKEKLSFLSHVGLITQKKKRELETNKFLRRHRQLRGLCLAPPDPLPEDVDPPPPWYSRKCGSTESAEASALEAAALERLSAGYPEKIRYMEALHLRESSQEQRKELKKVLKAVINDKLRRNGFLVVEDTRPTELSDEEASNIRSRGTKRQRSESGNDGSSPANLPKKSMFDASGFVGSDCPPVPAPLHRTPSPLLEWPANSARDFAQEFHQAVLQQTRQKSRPSPDSVVDERPASGALGVVIHCDDAESPSPERPRHNSEARGTPASSRSRSDGGFRWPGVEAVMEAYERHREEHKLEHNVLQEQCLRLKRRNRELSSTADTLRHRMADLFSVKKESDDERLSRQQTIDRLKGFLKELR